MSPVSSAAPILSDRAPRYRAEPQDQWVLEHLEDITLLYHRRSGQTHMMVSPAPEILAALLTPLPAREGSGVGGERSEHPDYPEAAPLSRLTHPQPLPCREGSSKNEGKSVEQVAAILATQYDLGDPREAHAAIAAHLADLTTLGLVHRA